MTSTSARPAGPHEPDCDPSLHTDATARCPGQRPSAAQQPSPDIPPEDYYAQIVGRIAVLAGQGCNAPTITRVLWCEGFTMAPGRRDPISLTTVRRLLRENVQRTRRRPVAVPGESLQADEWWLRDLAAELSMPSITLYAWARRGWVTVARKEGRPPYRLILWADRAELDRLRARRTPTDRDTAGADTVRLASSAYGSGLSEGPGSPGS
ncbi:hypothetical protein ACIBVL_40780 [Streptomyces sp. NPDC049687]|uniref:hypothetical protein n=1 Tax=Streptomyces sp. NPDC049687 TaxID=3365596 RepID=UPI0037AA48DF